VTLATLAIPWLRPSLEVLRFYYSAGK